MPLPVDNLTKESGIQSIRDAISESIAQCMREPIPKGYNVKESGKNKWCAAKCYSIARQNTGKSLK